ncbi:Rotatin [Phytophthora ramorum]|uniref:Rotatin n=1 Tax=Phytophthora ramorum TaxID=164328 RepID=UPI0030B50B87|nr:Rotatin [Phytophthora ramorum]
MEEDAGRLDALVRKLRHPMAKIRARALQSLLFKLRERLVRWPDLVPLQNALVPSLLACLEPPLELPALHVLQLLVQSGLEVFAASLQRFGAAQKLQRAANSNAELRPTYEKLLSQIYVTKVALEEYTSKEQVDASDEEDEQEQVASVEQLSVSRELLDRRRAPKVAGIEAAGWSFAQVTLSSVDEQFLFEFEVKLQLRTETQDLVTNCATFRNVLLRNFPAEVFLQRPAVLQYLLHLVQQPILPGSPATVRAQSDSVMERAMEVSMGVNYFDEMMNTTFSHKRGNLSGAVVMASLKAIESFLYALRLTRRACLDPTYVVHTPGTHVELFDSYDSRRGRYPRASVDVADAMNKAPEQQGEESASQLEQYSLGGAVYKIFMSLLPLLRSARHPRQHLLNFLLVALPDLPEKGCAPSAEATVQELDRLRLEKVFEVLSGICRPVPSEQVGSSLINDDLELTHSMTWKLVELVIRLIRLYPSSCYRVENMSKTTDKATQAGETDHILVPRSLWEAVKLWVASPTFPEVAANEWKDESLIKYLSTIDGTISAFVNLKHSSQQDARLILEFVEFAKAHREQLTKFTPWEKPATMNLQVAQKAIQTRCAFDDVDAELIADATLQAIWTALTTNGKDEVGSLDENAIEAIQFILCDLLNGLGEKKTSTSHDSMVVHFFRGLMGLVDGLNSGHFVAMVICEPTFLTLLLLTLARLNDDSDGLVSSAAFWGTLRLALNEFAGMSSDQLVLLQPVVPLLQHFAYIEPSEGSSSEQRSVQPQLAAVLNRMEPVLSDTTRRLLICRCLLHQSSYIRKAAASGVIRMLSRVNPSSVDWISTSTEIREDPFGGNFAADDKILSFEMKLMETPLPVTRTSEYQPSDNELSSQLSRLSHLCKVVTSTSSAFESMRETAFKELVMFIGNASMELFTLFEELGKLTDLLDLLRTILQAESSRNDSLMAQQALLFFRTLLLRSRLLRLAIQRDGDVMKLLMPLIFHSDASIRTQMYYILLLLTCSAENFIPSGTVVSEENSEVGGEARIPEMIKPTFGLHSGRWDRCCVVTCSLKQQLQASCTLLTKEANASWVQEVQAIITRIPFISDRDNVKRENESSDEFSTRLSTEYSIIVQKLRDAPSHGKCLNAVYHLMTICGAWSLARERFVGDWEADFERYFAVPPKSERDEVIISSLVSTLSVMFCAMTRGEQLRALVVLKRKVLPLLRRSQSKVLSLQVARLLLNVSESKVGDLFLSLAADTDIIATICTKYSAIYATESVLHAMMLEILLRFARGMNESMEYTRLSTSSREKICKRLVEMLSPLLTIVCSHRVPGSFLERDAFVVGSQCMVAIMRMLPRESLLVSDSPVQHTDSSILLDGSWASRFLFDHVSPTRELGYLVIEHAASAAPPSSRLLEMAFETSTDDTESDAVRAAACKVLTTEILQYDERSPNHQAAVVETFHGTAFAGRALRALSGALKDSKLFARSASALARIVRVLYIQSETLALRFGDMRAELEAAEEEYDVYPLVVQALSLREWRKKCDRYCSCCMLLPHCDDNAWRQSLLPAVLDLMVEVLNLLQAICRNAGFDQVAFFLMHTTLQFQLMELVQDVHDSLTSLGDTDLKATSQSHYEVLDLCAGTLSTLLVHRQSDSEPYRAPTASSFGVDFVNVVAKLLAFHHPIAFRVSFSRVVPAVSLLIPGSLTSSDASVTSALGSAVFNLYQEVTESRPSDASVTTTGLEIQGRVFPLTSIRRVSCALQVLLETSSTLRQLIHMKRGLPFAMTSIKESFSAIRLAGGFGGKRGRSSNSANTQDAYVLDLCGRIQTHMEVVSTIVGGDMESQRLAKDEGLLGVILSNWSVMKMAHVRGSQLLLQALHLLANYIYGNDIARGSLLVSLPPGSGKASGDGVQTLLSLLFVLASTRGDMSPSYRPVVNGAATSSFSAADFALSNAACHVLKAALLNTECVLSAVKTGAISKLIDSLQDRLKQTRQTSKTSHFEYENLAHMLSVLGSIACSEEGGRILYTSWATVLSLAFDDAMHSSDDAVRRSGCLTLRNLALSQATKNNFAMWEELLDDVVATCVRVSGTDRGDLVALGYLSAALWSLVYDNQKARALLLSRPAALRSLQQVLASQKTGAPASQQTLDSQAPSQDIAENLQRVLLLVQE